MLEKKSKNVAQIVASGSEAQLFVLVGTYKKEPDQLKWIGKRHLYNYPLSAEEAQQTNEGWSKVKELWLYSGPKDKRHIYAAEFAGIKPRKEFLSEHSDYPKGKGKHGDFYAVFNVKFKYQPTTDEAVAVVRVRDFAKRTPKIARAIEAYQNGEALGCLLDCLPAELAPLTHDQLRVCEAAVQYDFLSMMYPTRRQLPKTAPINYADSKCRVDCDIDAMPNTLNGMPYKMGEFFCGPGGLACGALNASIENPNFKIVHAWANDYDQQTCNTYAENICPDAPESVICADVRKLSLDDKRLTGIDGFAFGFPCNDFSVVGERKGFDGNYGPLYQYGVAILRKFQPLWFFAENVGELASANEGAAFKKILESMKESGYRIYPHLYKFEDYGVPQTRHRIIIIGIRNDLPFVFYPPSPSARRETTRHAPPLKSRRYRLTRRIIRSPRKMRKWNIVVRHKCKNQ